MQTTLCLLGSNITPLTQLPLANQRHLNDGAELSTGTQAETSSGDTTAEKTLAPAPWELTAHRACALGWLSSPQLALEGQRFKRNHIVPTLLLTHIFIRTSDCQAFLNSSLKVLWRLVSEHPSPSNNSCFWALLGSPVIHIHLLFWQMQWRSWAQVLAQWCWAWIHGSSGWQRALPFSLQF